MSLADARRKRDETKALLAQGIDPGAERKRQKAIAKVSAATTFGAVADEWLGKLESEGRAAVTVAKKRWLLGLVDRSLGNRPIAGLSPTEILATQSLRGALIAPKVKHHAAITDPQEIGALLRAIEDYRGAPQVEAALRILPLVFCRPGELRAAEWSEFDLDTAIWTIPAGRTKMRRPHRIPLSQQALEILHGLRKITGDGVLVFPSIRSGQRCLSENTLNAALRRMGYSNNEMTSHGFRGTAATRLNEMLRWHPDVIERALAHQEPNAVRRAYTSAVEYWPERVEMMQAWADYLDELKDKRRIAAAA